MTDKERLAKEIEAGAEHLRHHLAATTLFERIWDREPESAAEWEEASGLVNSVLDIVTPNTRTIHEGNQWPGEIDWDHLRATQGTHLTTVGRVSVDGASVGLGIRIGESGVDYQTRVFTPDGDGGFMVLAGRVKGIGLCLMVAFDWEDTGNHWTLEER